ncbi:MAG TPA: hypothetical protein VMQ11_19910 [Alphaproteobacteria bacterium]|nr:hypothetical protein [Alphaproteobacteria bacterium]
MTDTTLDRRAVLLATASAIALLAGSARRARALSIEEVNPTSREGLALANRCGGPQEHAALVTELQAELVSETRADGTGPASLTAACPICGCSVTVTKDGEVFGAKPVAR